MILQVIGLIIIIPLVVFWFWMWNDLAKNDYLSREAKNNWTLAFVFLSVFAAWWYYLTEYRYRNL